MRCLLFFCFQYCVSCLFSSCFSICFFFFACSFLCSPCSSFFFPPRDSWNTSVFFSRLPKRQKHNSPARALCTRHKVFHVSCHASRSYYTRTWHDITCIMLVLRIYDTFVFFFHPIYLSSPFYSSSLLVVTQIRGHIGSSCPLPTTVRAFQFYREKISALSSIVDSRRIVLTHARRSQQLILFFSSFFFFFANKFKISPRRDSNSRTSTSSIRGLPLVNRGDRLTLKREMKIRSKGRQEQRKGRNTRSKNKETNTSWINIKSYLSPKVDRCLLYTSPSPRD